MRVKFHLGLCLLLIPLSFSCYASLPNFTPAPSISQAMQDAKTREAAKNGDIGHNQSKGDGATPSSKAGPLDPQERDKQNIAGVDPNKLNAFVDRYNNLPSSSTGYCGRETRKSLEFLTDDAIEGTAKGGDLWQQLLKTGKWRPAYDGEDYTGKIVERSLQNNGYGHAECFVPDPNNPSKCLISSDFPQKGSLINSPRYVSHRDVVYIGNQKATSLNLRPMKNLINVLKHYVYRNVASIINQS